MKTKRTFKLIRVRNDGTLGSLFINRKARLPVGKWMKSESHPTKGFALRPAWHTMEKPVAPHLSPKGRAWFEVEIRGWSEQVRPASQGGKWFLSTSMKIVRKLELCGEKTT